MADTFLTIDTETTIKNTIGNNKGSAFCPSNKIVMIGGKLYGATQDRVDTYNPTDKGQIAFNTAVHVEDTIKLLVGQNIKYDIHHLRKEGVTVYGVPIDEWLATPGNGVWDTQVAEYLLTGQQSQFVSLDELAEKYGGTKKPPEIKALWDAGVQTEDIDKGLLASYLEGDVRNTELVAVAQMEEADRRGILPLIHAQMDALLGYEEIEYNGMHIDTVFLDIKTKELTKDVKGLENYLTNFIRSEWVLPAEYTININSNQLISALIFGGTLTYKVKEHVSTYKNGKPKFKLVDKTHSCLPFVSSIPFRELTSTPGVFKVDEATLTKIAGTVGSDPTLRNLVENLLKYKKMNKELNTYYKGIAELIYPDGKVHPNIQQCATDTGRTSSSEPNGQNMPSSDDSEVKKLFTSRYGDEGAIVSIDYKQLEVIALAYLSRDKQLLTDIKNGVDIHSGVGATLYGPHHIMTKEERRVVKTINFGLIYGGTAGALAAQAKCTTGFAQTVIDAFYKRYPGVKEWQKQNIDRVERNATLNFTASTKKGLPAKSSHLTSCTGRTYVFTEYDNPWRPGTTNFSPTEIKNYPVQGFATGDIVPTMVGVLWRALKNNDLLKNHVKMINVVHDELVFDVSVGGLSSGMLRNVLKELKRILEDAPKYLKDIYGIDFDLPLKVSVSIGPDWKEQKELELK